MSFLGKVYKYDREENFDAFLKALGMSDDQAAKIRSFKPSTVIEKNGDTYTMKFVSDQETKETKFVPGVAIDDVSFTGVPIKSTYTVEGNTVTQHIQGANGTGLFKREYNGDELKVTLTTSTWDGTAYRYYKA